MHQYPLLEILAMGFFLALIFGYITQKMGLSPIVGYLIAGFLVGPNTAGFQADAALAHELSEAGVILLMFGVGLHFDMKDLLAVKGVALPGALAQSSTATVCGIAVALAFGMTVADGTILGIGLAVASTVVLLRVLTDNNVLDTVHGHVAVGWLVVEDILTVLVLVILPSLATILTGTEAVNLLSLSSALGMAFVRIVLLGIIVLVIGGRVIPWVLTQVARTRSQELFTLTVLVAAFATAVGAAVIFHTSMPLGAFLGGMVVGKSSLSHQAGADLLPLRDAFAVLFFISVGMLFDPIFLINNYWIVLAALVIVLLIKPLTAIVSVLVLGFSVRTALTVAAGLSQVGEFSFILASQAQSLGIISTDVYNILVVSALVSITLNPLIFKKIPLQEAFLRKREKLWNMLNARADKRAMQGSVEGGHSHTLPANTSTAIVVGYGPSGQQVAASLSKIGITPIIIEMNVDTVNALNAEGIHAVYGDASKRDILLAAGIEHTHYLIITLPAIDYAASIATMASSLKENLRILARVRFIQDTAVLKQTGASVVVCEEEEVADAMSNSIIEDVQRCGPKNEHCVLPLEQE